MSRPITLEGFEGQTIQVQSTGAFSVPQLLVNGELAPTGQHGNQVVLRRNDGAEVIATWKRSFPVLGAPQLVIDDKTIDVVEPLKWYEWVWSWLPVTLILMNLPGCVAGIIGVAVNIMVFRSPVNRVLKFVLTAGIFVFAAATAMVATILFVRAVH